jgi:hypothetical protein
MITSRLPALDRRGDVRVPTRSSVHFEAPETILVQEGDAILEEVSAGGLRLRTRSHLHPEEAITIHVPNEAQPLHARVRWVHEDRATGPWSSPARIAGCRLLGDSIGRARATPGERSRSTPAAAVAKLAFGAVISLGAVAILVYLFVRWVTVIAGFTAY